MGTNTLLHAHKAVAENNKHKAMQFNFKLALTISDSPLQQNNKNRVINPHWIGILSSMSTLYSTLCHRKHEIIFW